MLCDVILYVTSISQTLTTCIYTVIQPARLQNRSLRLLSFLPSDVDMQRAGPSSLLYRSSIGSPALHPCFACPQLLAQSPLCPVVICVFMAAGKCDHAAHTETCQSSCCSHWQQNVRHCHQDGWQPGAAGARSCRSCWRVSFHSCSASRVATPQ